MRQNQDNQASALPSEAELKAAIGPSQEALQDELRPVFGEIRALQNNARKFLSFAVVFGIVAILLVVMSFAARPDMGGGANLFLVVGLILVVLSLVGVFLFRKNQRDFKQMYLPLETAYGSEYVNLAVRKTMVGYR